MYVGCDAITSSDNREHFELYLPQIPPTVNHYKQPRWTGKFISQYITKKGKEFRRDLDAIIPTGRQLTGPVSVSITLCMPDKRRRDVDNYLKATLDALMPKALEDDSQIVSLYVEKTYRKGKPGTYILITPCEEDQKKLGERLKRNEMVSWGNYFH